MKKVMFAAAALAAGIAVADGITSANVVGYQNKALRVGNTMTGSSFFDCGSEKTIDLTTIKIGGSAYVAGDFFDVVYVQRLNYDGSTNGNYGWYDLEDVFDPGWYDADNDNEPIGENDVTLDLGEGLWVAGANNIELQYNGEVLTSTQMPVPLRIGNTAVSNPYPTGLDLTKITVDGTAYVAGDFFDVVYVQRLNYDGSTNGNYGWYDLEDVFDPGWYDADNDNEPIVENDVIIDSAEGLWVAGANNINLQIPALNL